MSLYATVLLQYQVPIWLYYFNLLSSSYFYIFTLHLVHAESVEEEERQVLLSEDDDNSDNAISNDDLQDIQHEDKEVVIPIW